MSSGFSLIESFFDTEHYRTCYPDVPSSCDALLHFMNHGAKEGRCPHPLFDTAYYLRNNPDVEAASINPLIHYLEHGAREFRNAHPLFDERFYIKEHPEVHRNRENPLIHFLQHSRQTGYNPNPLFDIEFYLWDNPDLARSSVNPLIHYLQFGASEGRDPHPLFGTRNYLERYSDVAKSGMNPLRHYLEYGRGERRTYSRPLYFSKRLSSSIKTAHIDGAVRCTSYPQQPVPVFCVYGPGNVEFLKNIVVPAFSDRRHPFPIELNFVNYRSQQALMKMQSGEVGSDLAIRDWSEHRRSGHIGFGEGMNYLFSVTEPAECFFFCNPDSFPMEDCLERLMNCYLSKGAAIVEAKQWPRAHPKEFDDQTLETPWASGAFGLASAKAFQLLGGFDPTYFLYLEDVDLSWRAWLRGFRVLHEPRALCAHSTGLYSYRSNRFYYEQFFSLRNFLVISHKFFGEHGERVALAHLKTAVLPDKLYRKVLENYYAIRSSISLQTPVGENAEKIKILGLNLFHEFRE